MFPLDHIFRRSPLRHPFWGIAMAVLATASCLSGTAASVHAEQRFPNVMGVKVRALGADRFDFSVTVSSPYDSPRRFADAIRVLGKDGTVYGERRLLHDHAAEQPFTRKVYDVSVPTGVKTVIVQARDQIYGFGGKTVEVALPGR